jgi:hypothetical protein
MPNFNLNEFLSSPAVYGLYVGCAVGLIFLLILGWNYFQTKLEFGRFRRMLTDKMELEANSLGKLKTEFESVKKENENLRVKIQAFNEQPDRKVTRDLEVYVRAEKKMVMAAPGFAGPWEQAKQAAYQEMESEEAGKASPRRFFQRFFGTFVGGTAEDTGYKPLPSPSGKGDSAGS